MLLRLDIVIVLETVRCQHLLHLLVWAWGNLVNHRPGEGNLLLVLQVSQELSRHQSVLHPALSIGKYTSLHLVAIVRTVVHALNGERQFASLETLEQQRTNFTHRKQRLHAASQIGLVERVALLGDGERNHLQRRILENLHQTFPILKLRIGLQGFRHRGNHLLLDRTIRAEVHAERQIIIRCIRLVDDLEVKGLCHNDTTVVFARVQRVVQDSCGERTEDVTTAKMYPCRFLGSLLAQFRNIKLRKLVTLGFPLCGIQLAAQYFVQFHHIENLFWFSVVQRYTIIFELTNFSATIVTKKTR